MITGVSANDIFVYNIAKWLKKNIAVDIDVFEFRSDNQQKYDYQYYDTVISAKENKYLSKIRYIRKIIRPITQSQSLIEFLKGRHYDIIHAHWLIAPIVITTNLNNYCDNLFITFWGGELTNQKILGSKKLYKFCLSRFLDKVDCMINSSVTNNKICQLFPGKNIKYYEGAFGSAALEELYSLIEEESKLSSKEILQIPSDKTTIMIGYSAKPLHQHLLIIEALSIGLISKENIHLIAPMTRNNNDDYCNKVEKSLKESGCSYSIFKGFLDDKTIARLRNATDFVMQYSTFDGYSRSIIEFMCAKSIVLYGSWIDYEDHLKKTGMSAIKTETIEDGVQFINNTFRTKSKYSEMTNTNYQNGKELFFWSKCIVNWVNAYKENVLC